MRAHFHNTRNTALANAVAAVEEGVRVLDGSLAGIGGCPFAPGAAGNVPTEDLLYMFNRMGFDTGIDLDRAIEARAVHRRRARAHHARHGQPRAEMAHPAFDKLRLTLVGVWLTLVVVTLVASRVVAGFGATPNASP